MKNVYALQPYQVGSKNAKSLALVIPAAVAKKFHIDTSTIFALKGDDDAMAVTLRSLSGSNENLRQLSTKDSEKSECESSGRREV